MPTIPMYSQSKRVRPYDRLEAARQLDMWKASWLADVFDDTEILEIRVRKGPEKGRKIGKVLALKTNVYKKRKYIDTVVRPFIDKLSDGSARSITEHNDMIDNYALRYQHGYDPLTGTAILDDDEYKVSQKVKDFKREPLPTCRGQVTPNLENLKMIMDKVLDDEFTGRVEDHKIGLDAPGKPTYKR